MNIHMYIHTHIYIYIRTHTHIGLLKFGDRGFLFVPPSMASEATIPELRRLRRAGARPSRRQVEEALSSSVKSGES